MSTTESTDGDELATQDIVEVQTAHVDELNNGFRFVTIELDSSVLRELGVPEGIDEVVVLLADGELLIQPVGA